MKRSIKSYADSFVKASATRDPFVIAEDKKIKLRHFKERTELLGLYTIIKNNRFIFYNPFVEESMQRMVVAHEIAHDTLHRDIAIHTPFQEWELFNIRDQTEYEANIFASHLLLDEKEILDLVHRGYRDVEIAALLQVNVNMLIFKIYEMNKEGAQLNLREEPRSDFFRNINGKKLTANP